MRLEKDKCGVYNIYFNTLRELDFDISLFGEIFMYRRFSIWLAREMDMDEDFDCIATVFCDNILVDKKYDKIIGDELSKYSLPYRYF